MARTQAADYDVKREAITKHAAALFAEKGFAGASISDLAARCAISKSLVYHYYSSKEAILYDVMRDHIDDLLHVLKCARDSSNAPNEILRTLTRNLLEHYVGAASQQKVLLYELSFLPDDQQQEIKQKQRLIISTVEKILAHAQPDQAQNAAGLRAKTMLYFGMINWTHTWFNPSGEISRDQLADMAAETIIKSL